MAESDRGRPALSVLSGASSGAALFLDEVDGEVLVGTGDACHLRLADPELASVHVRLQVGMEGVLVTDPGSPTGVFVNDDRVHGQALLRHGDILWLGTPGERSSVMVQCRLPQRADEFPSVAMPPDEAQRVPAADEFFFDEASAAPPAAVEDFPVVEASPAVVAAASAQTDQAFFLDESEDVGEEGVPVPAMMDPPTERRVPKAGGAFVPETSVNEDFFFVDEAAVPAVAPAPPPPVSAPVPITPPPVPPRAPVVVPEPAPVVAPPAPARAVARPAPAVPPAAQARPPAAPPVRRVEQPRPAVARPARPRPGPPARVPGPRPQAARARGGSRGLVWAVIALFALGALGVAGWFVYQRFMRPEILTVAPQQARMGETVVVSGSRFGATIETNQLAIGDRLAKITKATSNRIEALVPELSVPEGGEARAPVLVRVGWRASAPVEIIVKRQPLIRGLSPDVGMPGEEVVVAGNGWGAQATVMFDSTPAEIVQREATYIRVRTPLLAAPGTLVSVTVLSNNEKSNAESFVVGKLPVIVAIEPSAVSPGDVVRIGGRGFKAEPGQQMVRIAGLAALQVAAAEREISVIVPTAVREGEVPLEVAVSGRPTPAMTTLRVNPPSDPLALRFVAESFVDAAGHEHAQIATELGPAFVVAAFGGKSAAQRAHEIAGRLNAAVEAYRNALDADVELRAQPQAIGIALVGKPEALLEATAADVAAYQEDWTGLKGRGGAVTLLRLATWWQAVLRDLMLVAVRGEKPRFAATLAPEGRPLLDLYQASARAGGGGIKRSVVNALKPQQRDALRVIGLRVPPAVSLPEASAGTAPVATPTPVVTALNLEGSWRGAEVSEGRRRHVFVTIGGGGGTFAYQGGVTATLPLVDLARKRDSVTFALDVRGSRWYYAAKWDGTKLAGTISSQPAGRGDLGTFELNR
jgi:hypothetical protein